MAHTTQGLSLAERKRDFIEVTRNAVLDGLDSTMQDRKGWNDSDLKELFKVVDTIAERNFYKSITPKSVKP